MLLLAAGGSRRLGKPKQLLMHEGETLLRRAARTALASVCHPMVAVLGAHFETLRAQVQGLPVETVVNDAWPDGIASAVFPAITNTIFTATGKGIRKLPVGKQLRGA